MVGTLGPLVGDRPLLNKAQEVAARHAGGVQPVAACELLAGGTVRVAPGGRIPVDGTVLAGSSFVDESRIPGESLPV